MKHLYRITFLIVLVLIDLFLTNLISKSFFSFADTEGRTFTARGFARVLVVKSDQERAPLFVPYYADDSMKGTFLIPQGKEDEIRKAAIKNTNSNYNFQVQYLSKGMQFFDVRFQRPDAYYRFRYLVIDNKIYPIYFGHSANPKLAKLIAFLVATFITYGFRLIIALLIHLHDLSMRKEKETPNISESSD